MAAPDPATAKRHHGVRGPGAAGPRPATGGALPGRAAGGVAFAVFGAGKFTNHASELASFNTYHRPAPNTFVYLGGVIELAGLLPPPPGNAVPHQVQRGGFCVSGEHQ
jgi:hypothetical protein